MFKVKNVQPATAPVAVAPAEDLTQIALQGAAVASATAAGGVAVSKPLVGAAVAKAVGSATLAAAVARQYTPGHWIRLNSGNDDLATDGLAAYTAAPTAKGIVKAYYWFELEPTTSGVYVWTELDADIAWCAARGLKFIPMIVDKTFSTDSTHGANPLPAYLNTNAFRLLNNDGGYTALKWLSGVSTPFKALLTTLKTHVSGGANYATLDGVALQETSLALTSAQLNANGYTTPQVLGDYYIDILDHCATTFPTKRANWFFNFIASVNGIGGQPQIDRVLSDPSILGTFWAGGPDIWPTTGPNGDGAVLRDKTYPKYAAHQDDCPLFGGVSIPSYAQVDFDGVGLLSMQDLLDWAVDNLFIQKVNWMYKPTGTQNFPTHGAAVIAANPSFNVETW